MKREIEINYGVLDDILSDLITFYKALNSIKKTMQNNQLLLKEQKGEACKAIEAYRKKIEDAITEQKEEISDIYYLIRDYRTDMYKYIEPESHNSKVLVDRNDIWINMKQMHLAVNDLNQLGSNPHGGYEGYSPLIEITEAQKQAESENKSKIERLQDDVFPAFVKEMENLYDGIEDIYKNNVKPFENTDDDYAKDAKKLYDKYSSKKEKLVDIIEWRIDLSKNILQGGFDALKETIFGAINLVVGLKKFEAAGMRVLLCNMTGQRPPKWASETVDSGIDTIKDLWNDPLLLLEGIGQGVSDAYETKGLAYCVGGAAFEIATIVVAPAKLAKFTKLGKATKGGKHIKSVSGTKGKVKPKQTHHYASNKHSTYTPQYEKILNKYGLDIDGNWNKDLLPHQGRHPDKYHEYILENLKKFDRIAKGDKKIFMKLYDNLKKIIKENPEMLYKKYWLNK